ncbi:hypothetical protein GH742_02440 [Legionella sp. MW5194]|nr:hypothetical protein GH742_02440 [Legionella sp. MW5194]
MFSRGAFMSFFPGTHLRRLRYHPGIRDLVRENHIHVDHLIYPLFVTHGKKRNISHAGLFSIFARLAVAGTGKGHCLRCQCGSVIWPA